MTGSASAGGAAISNAASRPAVPMPTDSAFVSMSMRTDAPSPVSAILRCYWVLQFDERNCYTCASCGQGVNVAPWRQNTFHFGVSPTLK